MFICNQQIPTSYICTVELVDKLIKNNILGTCCIILAGTTLYLIW